MSCRRTTPVQSTCSTSCNCSLQTLTVTATTYPWSKSQGVFCTCNTNVGRIVSNGNKTSSTIHINAGNIFRVSTSTIILSVPSCSNTCQVVSCCRTFCSNSLFGRFSQAQTFSYAGTYGVVLVSRQGDSGQNTDNCDYDHQFDQGETFLDCFHLINSS